jgi:hypothetical protein
VPKRPHSDVAARQFLRHDDHRGFRQPKAAEFLWDGQAEHAQIGKLGDDLHRDQFIFQVPAMRIRHHAIVRKTAELIADHLKLFVQPRHPKGRAAMIVAHEADQFAPSRWAVALRNQRRGRVLRLPGKLQIRQARHFALTHRDATGDLCQIFAKADLHDQRFHRSETPLLVQTPGPGAQLAQGLDIGGQP